VKPPPAEDEGEAGDSSEEEKTSRESRCQS
jgi:hypothetical protein